MGRASSIIFISVMFYNHMYYLYNQKKKWKSKMKMEIAFSLFTKGEQEVMESDTATLLSEMH